MLDAQKVRAITLDLDDTLWPVAAAIRRAEAALLVWLDLHAPMTAALFSNPLAMREVRAHLMLNRPELRHDLGAARRESIRLALYRAGEDPLLAARAYDVFFAARNQVDLYEDVPQALTWLSQRFPVIALTNGNADVHRIGIGHHFQGTLSARQVGVAKPDPRIFLAAADMAGVLPEQVLHVGDDPVADVLGSLNVGMQSAWVNRHRLPWLQLTKPDVSVFSLGELPAWLEGNPR